MALYTINPGDILMLTMFGKLDSQVVMNTFHYKAAVGTWPPDGPAEVARMCQRIEDDLWTANWRALVTAGYRLERIQGQIIYPVRKVYVSRSVGDAGDKVTTALPSFNTVSITRYGSIAGRGRSASLQISGLCTDQVVGSTLTGAAQDAFQLIGDFLSIKQPDSGGGVEAWLPVNWTYAKRAEENGIRGSIVHPQVRTEKRRVVGQGI